MMNKISVYIIIIIFLLVTNIATIVTVVSLNKQNKEQDIDPPVIELPRDSRVGFFHNQMGIREDQYPAFDNYNMQYNIEASQISQKMRTLRNQMVEEMASENPDTSVLENIAADFGNLHKEMKILTMEYYFNLKSVSDDMQKERLYLLFKDMLDPDGIIYGRGRGGAGRGLGRGRLQRVLQ